MPLQPTGGEDARTSRGHVPSGGRTYRLITQARIETGLWASATNSQRLVMLAGVGVLLCGCWAIAHNEAHYMRCWQELDHAGEDTVEVPCLEDETGHPGSARTWRNVSEVTMDHLAGCKVSGVAFSRGTPGLEVLQSFADCLPKDTDLQGAWFKISVERFNGNNQVWVPVESAGELQSLEVIGDVSIGSWRASEEIIRKIPGSEVALRAGGTANFSSLSMRVSGYHLYSGDPYMLGDGDLRVCFRLGDAKYVSVLGTLAGKTLQAWTPLSQELIFVSLPRLDVVQQGNRSAKDMARHLHRGESVGFLEWWPLRVLGVSLMWAGMCCMLFPNHVVVDFGGRCCCFRGIPPTIVTWLTTAVSSWFFFTLPRISTALVCILAPLLLARAAGVDLIFTFRQCRKRRGRHSRSKHSQSGHHHRSISDEDDIAQQLLRQSQQAQQRQSQPGERTVRIIALGIGVSLVTAGPVVQSVALVSWLGDYWDAFSQ